RLATAWGPVHQDPATGAAPKTLKQRRLLVGQDDLAADLLFDVLEPTDGVERDRFFRRGDQAIDFTGGGVVVRNDPQRRATLATLDLSHLCPQYPLELQIFERRVGGNRLIVSTLGLVLAFELQEQLRSLNQRFWGVVFQEFEGSFSF